MGRTGRAGGGALFTAAVTAGATLAPSFWPLAAVLAIAGLGYGSGQTAGNKAVAQVFPAGGRGTAMGIRQSGLPLGGMLAAVVIPPLATAYGWRAAVAAVAAICAAFGALCWVGLRGTSREEIASTPGGALASGVWRSCARRACGA